MNIINKGNKMKQERTVTKSTVSTSFGVKPNGVNTAGITGHGPDDGKWPEIKVSCEMDFEQLMPDVDLTTVDENLLKFAVADRVIKAQGQLRKDFDDMLSEAELKRDLKTFTKKYDKMKEIYENQVYGYAVTKDAEKAVSAAVKENKLNAEKQLIVKTVAAEYGMTPRILEILSAATIEDARKIHVIIENEHAKAAKK